MPQPFSRVAKYSRFRFSGDALLLRPQLAPYVATVINTWSHCDTSLTEILSNFLSADFEVVNQMYQAVVSTNARKEMLLAAAKHALGEESDDYLLLTAVFRVTRASRKRRNEFAHHLWGCSDKIPDGLLLLNPSCASEMLAAHAEHWAKAQSVHSTGDVEIIKSWHDSCPEVHISDDIMVFRESDLESDFLDAQLAQIFFSKLVIALKIDDPNRDTMRRELQSQPVIRQELNKNKVQPDQ